MFNGAVFPIAKISVIVLDTCSSLYEKQLGYLKVLAAHLVNSLSEHDLVVLLPVRCNGARLEPSLVFNLPEKCELKRPVAATPTAKALLVRLLKDLPREHAHANDALWPSWTRRAR